MEVGIPKVGAEGEVAMKNVEIEGAQALIIEVSSGTARVGGRDVELPLREFRLLAALAERVGDTVPTAELIQAVWPDEPWTAKENLYNLVNKLRRSIDGVEKFGKHIRNRRGFGYTLDLDPDEVSVIDPQAGRDEAHVIRLEPMETDEPSAVSDEPTEASQAPSAPGGRIRIPKLVLLGCLLFVVLAGMWSAGYLIASRAPSHEPLAPEARPEASVGAQVPKRKSEQPNLAKQKADQKKKRDPKKGTTPEPATAVAVGSVAEGQPVAAPGSDGSQTTSASAAKKPQPPAQPQPPLAPAPTRYLYHLVNPETGDHYVTIDGGAASEFEGRGYQGGPIGGIYTAPPKGLETRSISTNSGTGYIFASASSKTEPASRTVPLYFSSDGEGDFFYTTSSNEANQSGWSGSLVGYVRAI